MHTFIQGNNRMKIDVKLILFRVTKKQIRRTILYIQSMNFKKQKYNTYNLALNFDKNQKFQSD